MGIALFVGVGVVAPVDGDPLPGLDPGGDPQQDPERHRRRRRQGDGFMGEYPVQVDGRQEHPDLGHDGDHGQGEEEGREH